MLVTDMEVSTSSGYKDFVWAVQIHRFGFQIIGLWPTTDKVRKKSLWSEIQGSIILCLLIFICNVPMICTIREVWDDMIFLIEQLQTTLPFVMVSVKYVIMRWKRTVLMSIINMMAEDWVTFKLDKERNVMINRARTARLLMIIGYVFAAMGFFTLIIGPFFNVHLSHLTNFTDRKKQLPLQTYRFYDTDQSPQYELTYFFHVIAALLSAIIYMTVDIFLIVLILHICGQLENFRCQLVSLASCKHYDKVLKNIITTHIRIIRFAENIENTYSLMMLILVLYFIIIFCLSGFLLTIVLTEKEINEAVAQIYYSSIIIIVLLMNTFLYCNAGELIAEQCNAVHRAMCGLEWYKLESKNARNLILLMIRTNHPFYITAGKIIPLTMATFCSVLKTSSGYISFLLAKHG